VRTPHSAIIPHSQLVPSPGSMGRIGWFDALARRRFGDQATFDNILLDPLRDDLLRWTWMHERWAFLFRRPYESGSHV
jgi:hypothetical protein